MRSILPAIPVVRFTDSLVGPSDPSDESAGLLSFVRYRGLFVRSLVSTLFKPQAQPPAY